MEGGVWLKSPCRINQKLANNDLCNVCQSSETGDFNVLRMVGKE